MFDDYEKCGKWMLYYDNENVDSAWCKAKGLYRAGALKGIISMKVATAMGNPRASGKDKKVNHLKKTPHAFTCLLQISHFHL